MSGTGNLFYREQESILSCIESGTTKVKKRKGVEKNSGLGTDVWHLDDPLLQLQSSKVTLGYC